MLVVVIVVVVVAGGAGELLNGSGTPSEPRGRKSRGLLPPGWLPPAVAVNDDESLKLSGLYGTPGPTSG